jgi:hypothetical protein
VQCLRNKLSLLEHICELYDFKILCICEHWLHESEIQLYIPSGYKVASYYCRSVLKNGGCSIIVKNDFSYRIIDMSQFCIEQTCEICAINLIELNLIVVALYRAPCGNFVEFVKNIEGALTILSQHNKNIIVCGDINQDLRENTNKSNELQNLLKTFNLFCTKFYETRGKAALDYIITSLLPNAYTTGVVDLDISDHLSLVMTFTCETSKIRKKVKYVTRRLTEKGCSSFIQNMRGIHWSEVFSHANPFTTYDSFFGILFNLFFSAFPRKQIYRQGDWKLRWYTAELSKIKEEMLTYKQLYKSFNFESAKLIYQSIKKQYNKSLNDAKKHGYSEYIRNSGNMCKSSWKVVKKETGMSNVDKVPPSISPDEFNDYFLNASNTVRGYLEEDEVEGTQPVLSRDAFSCNIFRWKRVTRADVMESIKNLRNSKTSDIYDMTNDFLKKVQEVITDPLVMLINLVIESGIYPEQLKYAKVIPIYKGKGSKELSSSYRPISLVPIISKVIESVIYKQMMSYVSMNSVLTSEQYGFLPGKSATKAVESIIKTVLESMENKKFLSVISCDLMKAFDSISFKTVLNKLAMCGIKGKALSLIKSYLVCRHQSVFVNCKFSNWKVVNSGVPQGSILGPFLFVLTMNDLPGNLPCQSVLYADDVSLICDHRKLEDVQQKQLQNLNAAKKWFESNRLVLNEEKTQSLVFHLRADEGDTRNMKVLGFTLDRKLTWRPHIDTLCTKLSRVVYVIRKLQPILPLETLKTVYFALFNSTLSYGIHLWGHASSVDRLLKLQKKVVRIILGKGQRESCRPLFIELKIMTVHNLYILACLLYIKENIENYKRRQSIHDYGTRNRNMLDVPQSRLEVTKRHFITSGMYFYNKIAPSGNELPIVMFKKKVKNWLLRRPHYSIDEFLNEENCVF